MASSIITQLHLWSSLIRFSHSVFALPFALSVLFVVPGREPITTTTILILIIAIVAARTAAMAFNRLVDHHIDAQNPRTAGRELPRGAVSRQAVIIGTVASSMIFVLAAGLLGVHCLVLAPVVLGVLLLYSYTKRIGSWCHLVLGLALGIAPGGVWYALTAQFDFTPVPLMGGVLLWVAGFDIIYATQDVDFDRERGLHSLPVRLGIARALYLSLALHVAALGLFVWFGALAGLTLPFWIGLFVFSIVVLSQHRLVRPDDLSRVNQAFFTRNGIASFIFFVSVAAGSIRW